MKLNRTNEDSNFFGAKFSSRDNVRAPIQFRRKRKGFSSRRNPFVFTSKAPELLDWSKVMFFEQ